jgi:hypothetical protein
MAAAFANRDPPDNGRPHQRRLATISVPFLRALCPLRLNRFHTPDFRHKKFRGLAPPGYTPSPLRGWQPTL